jgi:hypothetical protein
MKTKLLAALLITGSAALAAAPAFASGYGPAPFYRPAVGAPSSQQGPSAQTIAAEEEAHSADKQAFGGSRDMQAQSGSRVKAQDNSTASASSR